MMLACQTQNKKLDKAENTPELAAEVSRTYGRETQQENLECNAEVCLQLRDHNPSSKTFDIYMLNSVPVAGFQCDFPGINITGSDGGLLKENGYQTSNSADRILSFSMQAKLIPVGEGVLTTIFYSDPAEDVCMTEIIFAGIGGAKLSNNAPECMMLN
jgi:hypothetical protein